jgi:hypothetical protein
LNVFYKSKHATLGPWYSTARVSNRLTYETATCLRAVLSVNHEITLFPRMGQRPSSATKDVGAGSANWQPECTVKFIENTNR